MALKALLLIVGLALCAAHLAIAGHFDVDAKPVNSEKDEKFLQDILNDPAPIPNEVDWRNKPNLVSSVKWEGGLCRAGWAFAVSGVLEGQQVKRGSNSSAFHGELVDLSTQNVLDCAAKQYGCRWGNPHFALENLAAAGGIESEAYYPYKGKKGACKFSKSRALMTFTGVASLPTGDEQALKKVVAKFGPVAVRLCTDQEFRGYKKTDGVFVSTSCGNRALDINHAALVVGYGTDLKQGDYWIVKNSWGPKWGRDGYIWLARNRNNQNGVATWAIIPTF